MKWCESGVKPSATNRPRRPSHHFVAKGHGGAALASAHDQGPSDPRRHDARRSVFVERGLVLDRERRHRTCGGCVRGPDVEGACRRWRRRPRLRRAIWAAIEGRADSAEVFAMQPYIAGHELARIYKHWRSRGRAPDVLRHARDELARLYVAGDDAQKRRVVDGALEHIFESVPCRADFEAWKAEPALAKAIEEAMEWAESRR